MKYTCIPLAVDKVPWKSLKLLSEKSVSTKSEKIFFEMGPSKQPVLLMKIKGKRIKELHLFNVAYENVTVTIQYS